MRLWSIHPKYLDTRGLTALWREALLAKKVLQNKTKGYKKHPQLVRFKNHPSSITAINSYLKGVFEEAEKRNFNFDSTKIGPIKNISKISVSSGQVSFEFKHLLKKLKIRDPVQYTLLKDKKKITVHPLFKKVHGNIERWEKV